jgi:hypothetical protein
MKNNKLMLQKIPLGPFIDILINVYNQGADFVDIGGTPDGVEDTLYVSVKEEYFEEDIEESKLSEDDLKLLLN